MYIKHFEMSFIVLAIILALQLIMLMFNVTKFMKPLKASDFVSAVAIIILLYIINALVLAIILPQNIAKIFMLFFAAMPFIVGKIAEYKTHKIFTVIQIFFIICSIIYIVSLNNIGV